MSKLSLSGRTAVITGAASGIGFAIAKRFAEHGAAVHLLDLDADKLKGAGRQIANAGREVTQHSCDVSSPASVAEVFHSVDAPVEILVNCAGIAHIGNLSSTSPEDMDRFFAVNIRGTYLCMRAAIDGMTTAQRGASAIVSPTP